MNYVTTIAPGTKVHLGNIDPGDTCGLERDAAAAEYLRLQDELAELQEELYAAGTHSLLVVFQGMDTSGKDGAIRKVLASINPQGCRVESFKVPSEEELAHDFLWRVHKVVPRCGMIAAFNRSHYEDVLVVRVHNLAPEAVWKARYDQINDFERLLAQNHTIILKFFLHISKKEQEERLLEREQDIEKAWKLSAGDWRERTFWDDYQAAYTDALSRCSTPHAPWHVVAANRKWFRDVAITATIVETLRPYRDDWRRTLEAMSAARRKELAAYRATLQA